MTFQTQTAQNLCPASTLQVAMLHVGKAVVAVPSHLIECAITMPTHFTPAPGGEPAMRGTFEHGGKPYPMNDLAVALGLSGQEQQQAGIAVLVAHKDMTMALRVDQIGGVQKLPNAEIARLVTSKGTSGISVLPAAQHELPLIYLGLDELKSLPGLVHSTNVTRLDPNAPNAPTADPDAEQTTSFLTFSFSDVGYALPLHQIQNLVKTPTVKPLFLAMRGISGQITVRTEDVYLLDHPAPSYGKNASAGGDPNFAIVVDVAGKRFALPADRIETLEKRPQSQTIHPNSTMSTAASDGQHGCIVGLMSVPSKGAPFLITDAHKVLEQAPSAAAIRMDADRDARTLATGMSKQPEAAYVEIEAGETFLTPLADIDELAQINRADITPAGMNDDVDGYLHHNGRAFFVRDLVARFAVGHAPAPHPNVLLQYKLGHAFIIGRAISIQHFHTIHRSNDSDAQAGLAATGSTQKAVQVVDAEGPKGRKICTLLTLAETI